MKKLNVFLNSTIFSRIMLFNIALIVFMTVVFQIVYYNYFKLMYDEQFGEINMQNVRQVQKNIDQMVLLHIINIPNTYFSNIPTNQEIMYPIIYDINDDAMSIIKIKTKLEDIKNTNDVIDTVDVYYKNNNILFQDSSVHFLNDEAFTKNNYPHWLEKYEKSISNVMWISTTSIKAPEKRDVFTFVRSIPFFAAKDDIQAIIAVNVNEKLLYTQISDIQEAFYIIDGEGKCISSNRKGNFQGIGDKNIKKVLDTSENRFFSADLKEGRTVISVVKSGYNDWRYVSVMPMNMFYKKSYQVRNVLFLIGMLLLSIYLGVSVVLTKRAHKPLASILKNVSNISNTMYDNGTIKNEYNLLSSTINNLAFKVTDLNGKVEANKSLVHDDIIRKLLNGSIINTSEEQLKNVDGMALQHEKFFCFIFKMFSDIKISSENKKLIIYNLMAIIKKNNEGWDIQIISDENDNILGIANLDSLDCQDEIISNINVSIQSIITSKYVLCIGGSYNITDEIISRSYKEALQCLELSFLNNKDSIIYFERVPFGEMKESGNHIKMIRKLGDYIKSCEENKLITIINEIVESLSTGSYNVNYCRNTLLDVVSTIRKVINEMGYNDVEIFGYDVLQKYKDIEYIESFKIWILDIIKITIESINEKRSNIDKTLEVRIKKIINDNIYKNISLEYVADELNMRSDALSKTFKTIANINFTDYIRGLKLEIAVKLLEKNTMSVNEISEKLGYNSTHYFIKLFKEKYGCTPKQYQKLNLYGNEEQIIDK